jgi:hypothetical protein
MAANSALQVMLFTEAVETIFTGADALLLSFLRTNRAVPSSRVNVFYSGEPPRRKQYSKSSSDTVIFSSSESVLFVDLK